MIMNQNLFRTKRNKAIDPVMRGLMMKCKCNRWIQLGSRANGGHSIFVRLVRTMIAQNLGTNYVQCFPACFVWLLTKEWREFEARSKIQKARVTRLIYPRHYLFLCVYSVHGSTSP